MRVIHVCSFFNTSSLYKNYFESLKKTDQIVTQEVYIPLYKNKEFVPKDYGTVRGKEKSSERLNYHYKYYLKRIERYLLIYRTKKLYFKLKRDLRVSKFDVLHAHSLFANGGVCYFLKKDLGCEYIVSFRQTDLEVYQKLIYYRRFAKSIIKNSKRIIFISHSLREKFLNLIKDEELKELIAEKGTVIPNGLNDKWIDKNIRKNRNKLSLEGVKFLYQGTFHDRKNIEYIIKIIERLNDDGVNAYLDIIGGGPEKDKIAKLISNSLHENKFRMKDWTNNFKDIVNNYRDSDIFIMPSKDETFGIAYIEALAVGLPIIYKTNDGFDGFFENKYIGVGITTTDFERDINDIYYVINNYEEISNNTESVLDSFLWRNISKEYLNIYRSLCLKH